MKKILPVCLVLSCFLLSCLSGTHYTLPVDESRVYMGLEVFIKWKASGYRGKKCLLVTNHSGIDRDLNTNISLLRKKGIIVKTVIAPEHGIYGSQNEYSSLVSHKDKITGITVYNMHKLNRQTFLKVAEKSDFIIFDIQDMGMRCYTYVSNLKFVMDAINGTGMELVVLDRPDPIGFLGTDGAFLDRKFTTRFISAFPAPLIYNMTIGEAAEYYNGEYAKNVNLKVIPMIGYKRDMLYPDTAMPWIPPSPNLPTYRSSVVYSGVVLLECINISLGRGTPMPFEYIGAPWIEPVRFCRELQSLGLKGFKFRPVYFTPNMRKYAGEVCGGAHLIYTGEKFIPTEMSYKIMAMLLKKYPQAKLDMTGNKYKIDAMAGTDRFRLAIKNNMTFNQYSRLVQRDVKNFSSARRKYLLYW